ncbi:MAG: ribose-phosphate diphosphokinase [Novosphingobium meiothermophilum]|uniref:ribose-phosphate diphosphokinase n=1 Tax=Novosphingobium TaxID=165696 RepID=UPI000D6E72C8|nr:MULTISPECIES: ribose-phosphate diphosphokinase [Novosphingobium]
MTAILHYFRTDARPAMRLAKALGMAHALIVHRRFPDGESLIRVGPAADTCLIHCSLHNADARLMPLLLAASALREGGAKRLILISPYLGYMRQDCAFTRGEAVSQRVLGRLLSGHFDALLTVDPHLHRTSRLEDVVPGIPAINVPAAPALAAAVVGIAGAQPSEGCVLVGPDEESRPWVEAVAAPIGLEIIVGRKHRTGDRSVQIELPAASAVRNRQVILVDDVISSGGTMLACARQLQAAGAIAIAAVASHCLARPADLSALAATGIGPVLATDSVPGKPCKIAMAGYIAEAVRKAALA